MRSAGDGIPARRRSAIAFSRACFSERPRWRTSTSAICSPMVELAVRILCVRQEFREMDPALTADFLQPLQLGERIGVIVDAQVEIGPYLVAIDQKRGGLLAALVAARGFAGLQRRDEPARKRQ